MRSARFNGHLYKGDGYLPRSGGVSVWGVSAQGVSVQGCVCPGGCTPSSPCRSPIACCNTSPCPLHAGIHSPPVNRMTDRCKNITFPQLRLRVVARTQKRVSCCTYCYCCLNTHVRFRWLNSFFTILHLLIYKPVAKETDYMYLKMKTDK